MQERTMLLLRGKALEDKEAILYQVRDLAKIGAVTYRRFMTCRNHEWLDRFLLVLYPGDHLAGTRKKQRRLCKDDEIGVFVIEGDDAVARLDQLVGASRIPIPGEHSTLRESYGDSLVNCPVDEKSARSWLDFLQIPVPA